MFYTVIKDNDFSGLIIFFGSQESIDQGFSNAEHVNCSTIRDITLEVGDNGETCEDYALCSTKFTEAEDIPTVKAIVEKHGVTYNSLLNNIGWG